MLFAILLAAVAAPASAAAVRPMSCLHVSSGTTPSSYDGFRACQIRTRAASVAAAESKGVPLTEVQLDAIDDFQRAEARRFLSQPGTVVGGDSKSKLGGVTATDLGRTDPKSAAAIQGLQGRLQAAAGDGKDGITPAMADDIRATLMQSQGGISPDMKDLLDSVQRDGAKLTPETMKKLQDAGKAAKGDGLDLNIDPNTEKLILEHDFDKDAAAPAGM